MFELLPVDGGDVADVDRAGHNGLTSALPPGDAPLRSERAEYGLVLLLNMLQVNHLRLSLFSVQKGKENFQILSAHFTKNNVFYYVAATFL